MLKLIFSVTSTKIYRGCREQIVDKFYLCNFHLLFWFRMSNVKEQFEKLKLEIDKQQSIFTKPVLKSNVITILFHFELVMF